MSDRRDETNVRELAGKLAEEWAGAQEVLETLDEGVRQLLRGSLDRPEAQAFLADLGEARAQLAAAISTASNHTAGNIGREITPTPPARSGGRRRPRSSAERFCRHTRCWRRAAGGVLHYAFLGPAFPRSRRGGCRISRVGAANAASRLAILEAVGP